jgi:hypothetical protein
LRSLQQIKKRLGKKSCCIAKPGRTDSLGRICKNPDYPSAGQAEASRRWKTKKCWIDKGLEGKLKSQP